MARRLVFVPASAIALGCAVGMTVAAGGGVGCSPKAAPTSSAASAEVVASAVPAPPPAPSASAAVKVPLQVQKFVLTSEVKGKEPVDELATAAAGKRLYAHLQVRNRGETRPLRLEFRVDGALRSKIDLEVIHSWSYRTWGYNTLRATDAGLVAEAKILDGEEIVASAKIPIAKEEKTKKK